jgi:hypothetical protein
METESETVFAKLAEQTHDIICKNRLKKKAAKKSLDSGFFAAFLIDCQHNDVLFMNCKKLC